MPSGTNSITITKIRPWYSSQDRVRSEVTRAKNVMTAAPSAGPKNVPAPPMKVCKTTLAEAWALKMV